MAILDHDAPLNLCIGPIAIDSLSFKLERRGFLYPGGNAVIFSSIAARMGIQTTIGGQVGNDLNGCHIKSKLRSHGVDVSLLKSRDDLTTKSSDILIDADGAWQKLGGATAIFSYLDSIDIIYHLKPYSHLHVGGINSLLRSSPDLVAEIIRACRDGGLTVSIGLNSGSCDRDSLNRMISSTDMLFCNWQEFASLVQLQVRESQELIDALLASRFQNCVVTLGDYGAFAKLKDFTCYKPASPLRRAVNTLGAGDVFSAVMISALLSRYHTAYALKLAAFAASESVKATTWDEWTKNIHSLTDLIYRYEADGLVPMTRHHSENVVAGVQPWPELLPS